MLTGVVALTALAAVVTTAGVTVTRPTMTLRPAAARAAPQEVPAVHTPAPVDVARIRQRLQRQELKPPSATEPMFRVRVSGAPLTWADTREPSDYAAPVPPGGLYAFELRRQTGNPWIGQPLVVIDVMPAARAIGGAIHRARRSRATRAAEREVQQALELLTVGP